MVSMFDKQPKEAAVQKRSERKRMVTKEVPPTVESKLLRIHFFSAQVKFLLIQWVNHTKENTFHVRTSMAAISFLPGLQSRKTILFSDVLFANMIWFFCFQLLWNNPREEQVPRQQQERKDDAEHAKNHWKVTRMWPVVLKTKSKKVKEETKPLPWKLIFVDSFRLIHVHYNRVHLPTQFNSVNNCK